eukprot:3210308-Rhodomonas_salina.1
MTCDVTVSLTVGASSVQAAGSAQNEGPFSLAMSFPDSDADSTTYKVGYSLSAFLRASCSLLPAVLPPKVDLS